MYHMGLVALEVLVQLLMVKDVELPIASCSNRKSDRNYLYTDPD